MRLIEWRENTLNIAPEALGVAAFRKIWNSDKSATKEKAIMELTTLYNMYDPRSDYMFEIDPIIRLEKIKEETGLPPTWTPNKNFEDAVGIYKYLTQTTSSITLDNNRKLLAKIDEYLNEAVVTDDNVTKLIKAISDKNDLAVSIAKAEKAINKDVEEHSDRVRGKGNLNIGDLGIKQLFK
jgi:hypothetical protein